MSFIWKCSSCYIETYRHFKTRIDEHVKTDRKSNIYIYINIYILYCFSILDYALTQFQIEIKEVMYIYWGKRNLYKQLKNLATTLFT